MAFQTKEGQIILLINAFIIQKKEVMWKNENNQADDTRRQGQHEKSYA